MTLPEITEHMTRAINDRKVKISGGPITCTMPECQGKPQHAHYATPTAAPIARTATITLGGIRIEI